MVTIPLLMVTKSTLSDPALSNLIWSFYALTQAVGVGAETRGIWVHIPPAETTYVIYRLSQVANPVCR